MMGNLNFANYITCLNLYILLSTMAHPHQVSSSSPNMIVNQHTIRLTCLLSGITIIALIILIMYTVLNHSYSKPTIIKNEYG